MRVYRHAKICTHNCDGLDLKSKNLKSAAGFRLPKNRKSMYHDND